MKIKELLESLSEVMNKISEIRINGNHYKDFDECKEFGLLDELEVGSWRVSVECDKVILIIHTDGIKGPEYEDSVEEDEENELTVGDVLSSIHFDDENTIIVYGKTGQTLYDSDEDDVVVLCEFLGLDVKEYVQIHRGSHQTIEINLKNYN